MIENGIVLQGSETIDIREGKERKEEEEGEKKEEDDEEEEEEEQGKKHL